MSRPARPTTSRWLVPAILAVALLALGGAPVAFAQPVDDLRKDIEALKQDGVWGHPNTILIDRAGRMIGRVRGERDWSSEDARRLIETLLNAR